MGWGTGTSTLRRPDRRAGLAITAVAGALLLTAFVATGDQVPLATQGERRWTIEGPAMPDTTRVPTEPATSESTTRTGDISGVGLFGVLMQAAILLAAAVLLVLSVRTMQTWRRANRDVDRPPIPEPPLALRPNDVVDALDEGIEAMADGPVDDVIVECWVRLEAAAADAGVERHVSETSSELAARVLADLHAPPDAVDELLVRYRTVRYSRHRLGEADRAVALRALGEIRASIVGTPS